MSFSRCVASWRLHGWGLALTVLLFASIAHAEGKNLRVVTDNNYPPYVFQGPDGMPEGYIVDLWRMWQEKTGIKVDFKAMQWSEAQRALLDGQADVIDMIFRTPVREPLTGQLSVEEALTKSQYAAKRQMALGDYPDAAQRCPARSPLEPKRN